MKRVYRLSFHESPLEYSARHPRLPYNYGNWRKCNGYLIPVDSFDSSDRNARVAYGCIFYVDEQATIHCLWGGKVTHTISDRNAVSYSTVMSWIRTNKLREVQTFKIGNVSDYQAFERFVKKSYRYSSHDTFSVIWYVDLYYGFGLDVRLD